MNPRQFVSGLPGPDLKRVKTFEQVIAESKIAKEKRRQKDLRKRLYSSPLTKEVKRATDRMIGERDD